MRDAALQRIQTAKIRRLEIMEEQIATVGEIHAEPSLITERDDLKKQLGLVSAVVDGSVDDETRRLLRRYDQADLNIAVLSNVVQRVSALEEWIGFDRGSRESRQRVLNLWLGLISAVVLIILGKLFL